MCTPRGLRTELYGRSGAGPSQRSQSSPGSIGSSFRSQGLLGPPTSTSTQLILPMRPLRTYSIALRNSLLDRCWLPVWKTTLCLRTASMQALASLMVSVSGFSP